MADLPVPGDQGGLLQDATGFAAGRRERQPVVGREAFRLVRREEVEAKRTEAIDAEKQLMKEREEHNQLRRKTQKAASAPALVSETTASAVPSPAPSPSLHPREDFGAGLGSDILRSRTPVEEEAALGLG